MSRSQKSAMGTRNFDQDLRGEGEICADMFSEHVESHVSIDIYCYCLTVITLYSLRVKRRDISDIVIIRFPQDLSRF